eukprot:479837-Prymnesium_polylepis.1
MFLCCKVDCPPHRCAGEWIGKHLDTDAAPLCAVDALVVPAHCRVERFVVALTEALSLDSHSYELGAGAWMRGVERRLVAGNQHHRIDPQNVTSSMIHLVSFSSSLHGTRTTLRRFFPQRSTDAHPSDPRAHTRPAPLYYAVWSRFMRVVSHKLPHGLLEAG